MNKVVLLIDNSFHFESSTFDSCSPGEDDSTEEGERFRYIKQNEIWRV